jgi:transcriptional regulator with XRE-family HTH domain
MYHPIKIFRRALGLTQAKLAEQVGVARLTVVDWEAGRTKPGPDSLPKLAVALRQDAVVLAREIFGQPKPHQPDADAEPRGSAAVDTAA